MYNIELTPHKITNITLAEMKEKWRKVFASQLTEEECQKIYLHSHLWHVFSFKKVSCKTDEEARRAFDQVAKNEVYSFYEINVYGTDEGEYAKLLEACDVWSAADLENEEDIYIVDKDFKWTYVVTHEKEFRCGPYFCCAE